MLFIHILQRWTSLLRTEARVAARGCRNGPAGKRETEKPPSFGQQQRLKSGTQPEVRGQTAQSPMEGPRDLQQESK